MAEPTGGAKTKAVCVCWVGMEGEIRCRQIGAPKPEETQELTWKCASED